METPSVSVGCSVTRPSPYSRARLVATCVGRQGSHAGLDPTSHGQPGTLAVRKQMQNDKWVCNLKKWSADAVSFDWLAVLG